MLLPRVPFVAIVLLLWLLNAVTYYARDRIKKVYMLLEEVLLLKMGCLGCQDKLHWLLQVERLLDVRNLRTAELVVLTSLVAGISSLHLLLKSVKLSR